MKGQNNKFPFRKTAACPSSTTLLSFRSEKLSAEIATLVKYHLHDCEFCNAEIRLLAHHQRALKTEKKPPEIPMNLRILAESLLCQSSKLRVIR